MIMNEITALDVLSRNPSWALGTANLSVLNQKQGDQARSRAESYGTVYEGRRGAMIVDVVASRQRKYTARVLPTVRRWEESSPDSSLATLAADGIDARSFGLQDSEAETIQTVAKNLAGFTSGNHIDEDQACKLWASNTGGVEHAPDLDVIVGAVKGIGPALFAYADFVKAGESSGCYAATESCS